MDTTTIQIPRTLKSKLEDFKQYSRETYADIILNLISKKTLQEKQRTASIERNTKETQINLSLNIDGKGKSEIFTQIGFLTHMLENFSKHGLFDLNLTAKGDIHVDQHHLVEDIGIALGQAFKDALGDKRGINRAGFFAFPMDDALSIVAVDINGRPASIFEAKFEDAVCGALETRNIKSFFSGFSIGLGANIVVRTPISGDTHHQIESIFKAFGKAMKMACSKDRRVSSEIPSTKGLIEK